MTGVDTVQEVVDRQDQDRIAAEKAARLIRQQAVYARGFADGVESVRGSQGGWWTVAAIAFAAGLLVGTVIMLVAR